MYPHILLAVDGSEHSVRATEEAIKIARLSAHSKIEVVFVVDFSKAKEDVLHAEGRRELKSPGGKNSPRSRKGSKQPMSPIT